jgi:hypothetical protein
MNHLTTYQTSGWPTDPRDRGGATTMDPMFSKALVDRSVPRPPARRHRPASGGARPRLRGRLALVMRRWADHLEAPAPQPAGCS